MNYFFGFSYWKHDYIRPFFPSQDEQSMVFINPLFGRAHLSKALRKGLGKESRIYIWGRKHFDEVEAFAKKEKIPLFRIEDGFIRSVGLGSDLTQPYSQVIDARGIYFDPTQESDLEHILQTYDFHRDLALLERAGKVRSYLIEHRLSKYNLFDECELDLPEDRMIIAVPGQVEDDASIRYGAEGMTNLELLRQVRSSRPDAYIVYKPHPDVLVGNRIGEVEEAEALRYSDKVVTSVSIDTLLADADEVHTMTSLVGFEALLRGKRVVTYGLPFYAGWGLTEDSHECTRRTRVLDLDELVAGALLLYPHYIDPVTGEACEIELMLKGIEEERLYLEKSALQRTKKSIRDRLSRISQRLLRSF